MKKCLVVVDYQNDFVSGSLGFEGAEALEAPILKRIQDFKASHDAVVFTKDTHDNNYLETQEGKHLPIMHCIKGTWGHDLYGAIKEEETLVFEKGAFGSLELGAYLKQHQFDVVELVGLVSNICIISTAVIAKAALPEAEIVVDASMTGSYDKVLHEQALNVMAGFQVKVNR